MPAARLTMPAKIHSKTVLSPLPECWQTEFHDAFIKAVPAGQCNQVYRIDTGSQRYALRLNNPDPVSLGIDPWREQQILRAIANRPWAPEVLFVSDQCLLTRWARGEPPVGGDLTRIHWLGHALNSIHELSGNLPVVDIPAQLRALAERCGSLANQARSHVDLLLSSYQPAGEPTLCHHDWHPGNLLTGPRGWTLLDWEFAGIGDPRLDIGAAINGFGLSGKQVVSLSRLTGFGAEELESAARIMRTLEVIWYAANPGLRQDDDRAALVRLLS